MALVGGLVTDLPPSAAVKPESGDQHAQPATGILKTEPPYARSLAGTPPPPPNYPPPMI